MSWHCLIRTFSRAAYSSSRIASVCRLSLVMSARSEKTSWLERLAFSASPPMSMIWQRRLSRTLKAIYSNVWTSGGMK